MRGHKKLSESPAGSFLSVVFSEALILLTVRLNMQKYDRKLPGPGQSVTMFVRASEDEMKLRTLPLGLSSSMATMVAGGPDRDSLHSANVEERRGERR